MSYAVDLVGVFGVRLIHQVALYQKASPRMGLGMGLA
ncbi:hypothetical protein HMPREF9696_01719 [Afipia clevelandensis ATCC 49720]|uniref:Uncharacterized protein n=1 Tax=Afipia clevelandensis ATCC 49720 TaxID=883079 RepID=K8PAK0_9BRAD|nr:hypothetical protein HMPREF9696_01719 [Afipia clevelandensis ATCC 49720]